MATRISSLAARTARNAIGPSLARAAYLRTPTAPPGFSSLLRSHRPSPSPLFPSPSPSYTSNARMHFLSVPSSAFCKAFQCSVPIVCPPMTGVAGGELAAEVYKAGGVGLIGAGHRELEHLKSEVEKARSTLRLSDGDELPIGIGLVLFRLERPLVPTSPSDITATNDAYLRYILFSARARYIWLSFSHGNLEGWVKRVRELEVAGPEGEGEKARSETIKVLVMVQSEAMGKAAREWGVEAVVAQGTESGGHGPSEAIGLPLADLLARLSPIYPSTTPPFLLAAGGIASLSSVLSSLSLGAAAVIPGTALCAAAEALLPPLQKENLVRAEMTGGKTTRGVKWDVARDGENYWPEGVDGRAIRNLTSEEVESEPGKAKERYDLAVKEGDIDRIVTWAGTGVGDVTAIRPAREIIRSLMGDE